MRAADEPCAHTCGSADHATPQAAHSGSYFNSGLIVLRPSKALFAHMLLALKSTDLSLCPFADQDFLNAYFCGAWTALPRASEAARGTREQGAARREGAGSGERKQRGERSAHVRCVRACVCARP